MKLKILKTKIHQTRQKTANCFLYQFLEAIILDFHISLIAVGYIIC